MKNFPPLPPKNPDFLKIAQVLELKTKRFINVVKFPTRSDIQTFRTRDVRETSTGARTITLVSHVRVETLSQELFSSRDNVIQHIDKEFIEDK